jgi:hypothetical protein
MPLISLPILLLSATTLATEPTPSSPQIPHSSAASSPAPYDGNWWERETLYLATDSICFDGIVAIIAGHGCTVLNTRDIENGAVVVWCETHTREDAALEGEYILWRNEIDLIAAYLSADLMCVDTSFTLLWSHSEPTTTQAPVPSTGAVLAE